MSTTAEAKALHTGSIALDLSVAARAYSVATRALELLRDRTSSLQFRERVQAAQDVVTTANCRVETLMARLDLHWQTAPVARFLRSQLDLLKDALEYARPEAIGEYGDLEATAGLHLDRRYRLTSILLGKLERVIERQVPDWDVEEATPVETPSAIGALTANQRTALRSCLLVLAKELVLLQSYALSATPPHPPAFTSAYCPAHIFQILSQVHEVEACLDVTGVTLAVAVPWPAAVAQLAVHYTARAEESAQQVLHMISQSANQHLQLAAAFYQSAHLAYRTSLNL
jgi:hypothetical protein